VERNLFTYANLRPCLAPNNCISLHILLSLFLEGITLCRQQGCVLLKGSDERNLGERQRERERERGRESAVLNTTLFGF
jgi:hypothetical protein